VIHIVSRVAGASAVATVLLAAQAHAFGTVNSTVLGQRAEHERMTRAALACPGGAPSTGDCFEPLTLDQLAGRSGTFGGVGAPDRDEIPNPDAHCDNADFLDTSTYPRTRSEATDTLDRCLTHLGARFNEASIQAREIVPPGPPLFIVPPMVDITNCPFSGTPGARGKCDVLDQFGRALHGVQDFYAHSNWTDRTDTTRPISLTNPPGLNRPGPVPFLILRHITTSLTVPRDLSTGCFTFNPFGCRRRVTHGTLNKDHGLVDPATGTTTDPTTDRGRLHGGDNFANAVAGAIAETRRQWADMRHQLVAAFGAPRAALIICAITRDDPLNDCQGRRLGIVIDSSGSNMRTDPGGLRIGAGGAFNATLTTEAQVTAQGHGKSDLSMVLQFSDSASVVSPLADPSLARFDGIGAAGGTSIASGVELARAELTASVDQPPPFRRFGIVVLTDGEDPDIGALVAAIDGAAAMGIRTSIGFLSPPPNPVPGTTRARAAQLLPGRFEPSPRVIAAVQRSGGVAATIDSARAQRAFVDVAVGAGLTAINDVNGTDDGGPLARAVGVRGRISPRRDVDVWTYRARRRERVAITLRNVRRKPLRLVVRRARTGRVLGRARSRRGRARVRIRPGSTTLLEVVVSPRTRQTGSYRLTVTKARRRR